MQYSYERWLNEQPDATGQDDREPDKTQDDVAERPAGKTFPFAEDLEALQQNLSLGFDEGLQAYRQHRMKPQAGVWQEAPHASAEDGHWDDLAKLVADHVLAYMLEHPLKEELRNLRAENREYYRDNRSMAEQVRKLVDENEHLRRALQKAENELTAFHKLAGSFYVRQ